MANRARTVLVTLLATTALVLASWSTGQVARAASDCPPEPTSLQDLIAVEDSGTHPLSDTYPRAVWAYTERAAACFGERAITVSAVVAGPEGIGGVTSFVIEPTWVIAEAFVAVDRSTTDPAADQHFFVLAVPPRLERAFAADKGRWVRITGHFNDPVAKTCRVTHGDPPDAPAADVAVEICRTAFVLTSIRPLGAGPGTDTMPTAVAADDASVPIGAWLSLAVVAVLAFVAGLRRPERRSR